MDSMEITGAILAGGRSMRMGRDKALVPIGCETLLERTYKILAAVCSRTMIISGQHSVIGGIAAPVLPDAVPIHGSLTGIASALLYAETPYVFVMGCDMPFATEEAVRYVISQANGEDVVVPKVEKGFEPLHALYNRSCLSMMLSCLERRHMKIYQLFSRLTTKAVQASDVFWNRGVSVFTNINTEEDLSRVYGILSKTG